MIETIAMHISSQLVHKQIVKPDRRDPIAYGLSLILSAMIITTTIYTIGIITGMFIPCLLYSAIFWISRHLVGLHHCTAYYRCFSLSVGLYALMTVSYLFTSTSLVSLSWMALSIVLLLYAWYRISLVDDATNRLALNLRFKRLCAIIFIAGVVSLLTLANNIKPISFPLSYGIFVISLLFVPATNTRKKEKSA